MIRSIIFAIAVLGLLASFIIFLPSKQSYLSAGLGAAIALIILINFIISTSSKKKYI
jgi:hypothetical protein